MTIRNRLTVFIFFISAVSTLITAGIILMNASYYLEKQSGDSLRALEASFRFIYEDFVDQNRSLAEYTAKNSDILDFVSESHLIMAFVTKRAVGEELEKLVNENNAVKYAYIEKSEEVILGNPITMPVVLQTENYIKINDTENAFFKLKTPIGDNKNAFLVTIIDLSNLVTEKLSAIRINNKTHFFIFHSISQSFLLHTESSILNIAREELKHNIKLKEGLNSEGLHSYKLNGTTRMAYLTFLNGYTFGASIPYSSFNFSVESLLQFFITTLVIIICIIILVSFFASRYVTKPLREMALSVKDISEKKYERRIIIDNDDEVGIVSKAINSMADQIKEYTENLEKLILERTKQLQQTLDELKKMSITDDLTKLNNRKHFEESLEKELARANRNLHGFSLIFFDLDHFKKVNDTFGHKQGDNVLISTGRVIRETIRETDLSARWGGEEFIIILYNTDVSGAFKVAEKLRERLAEINHPQIGQVTGSFGCTEWIVDDDTTSIVLRCDEALYKSKANGRNRTTIY